jgi:aspartyl-tRNA(Asn)/glutamyl-tRNA(Gln) amidotransferase subunit C
MINGGEVDMTISEKEVQRIATLARLHLSEEEMEPFTSQLNHILQLAEKLSELDTEQVKVTSHGLHILNRFREDEVAPSLDPKNALSNAPKHQEALFKVPAIFTAE